MTHRWEALGATIYHWCPQCGTIAKAPRPDPQPRFAGVEETTRYREVGSLTWDAEVPKCKLPKYERGGHLR